MLPGRGRVRTEQIRVDESQDSDRQHSQLGTGRLLAYVHLDRDEKRRSKAS